MSDTAATTPLPPGLDRLPPTQDDLPYSDGEVMESQNHVLQIYLLMETLRRYLTGVRDAFIGADMFVYFSPDQVKTHDFRGPDFFVVLDVPPGPPRKSWVVWQEDGRTPDVVIEVISDSTASIDKGEKLLVYQNRLHVPEYFWFHPFTGEVAGVALNRGVYRPIVPDADGRLACGMLGLQLVVWDGIYANLEGRWLRWVTPEGDLLPTSDEADGRSSEAARQAHHLAEQERERAEEERQRAEQERHRAEQERQRAAELESMLARYRERFGDLPG